MTVKTSVADIYRFLPIMRLNSGLAADVSGLKMLGAVLNVRGQARESRMLDQILGHQALPTRFAFQVEPV
jgi:hypothetical protein